MDTNKEQEYEKLIQRLQDVREVYAGLMCCTEAADALTSLMGRVRELEAELETERMRLAACGTAALGYFDGCCDEYHSASLGDVLRLRNAYDALRAPAESELVACKHEPFEGSCVHCGAAFKSGRPVATPSPAEDRRDAECWRALVEMHTFNNKPQVGFAINRAKERAAMLADKGSKNG